MRTFMSELNLPQSSRSKGPLAKKAIFSNQIRGKLPPRASRHQQFGPHHPTMLSVFLVSEDYPSDLGPPTFLVCIHEGHSMVSQARKVLSAAGMIYLPVCNAAQTAVAAARERRLCMQNRTLVTTSVLLCWFGPLEPNGSIDHSPEKSGRQSCLAEISNPSDLSVKQSLALEGFFCFNVAGCVHVADVLACRPMSIILQIPLK